MSYECDDFLDSFSRYFDFAVSVETMLTFICWFCISQRFLVESLGFSVYEMLLYANRDS